MTTVQTTNPTEELLASLNTPTNKAKESDIGATQNRFLSLLVAQIRNQDPLNPLDNAQVTTQLAQISTVNGLDKLNSTLETLLNNYSISQQLEAANLVGHGILASGSQTTLASGHAFGGAELHQAADDVVITIKDASGGTLKTVNLGAQPAGVLAWEWDGTVESGAPAADGVYSFSVKASSGGEAVTADTLSYGVVNSVSTGKNGISLNVNTLGVIGLSDIKQIL